MKKCPICAEEIQEDAIKCRFCGEWITKPDRTDQPKATPATATDQAIKPGVWTKEQKRRALWIILLALFNIIGVGFILWAKSPYTVSPEMYLVDGVATTALYGGLVAFVLWIYKLATKRPFPLLAFLLLGTIFNFLMVIQGRPK